MGELKESSSKVKLVSERGSTDLVREKGRYTMNVNISE